MGRYNRKNRLSEYEKGILGLYSEIRPGIEKRVSEFRGIWNNAGEEELFAELSFCLFTPQSSARQCWKAVTILLEKNLLYSGSCEDISEVIRMVRFRNNKARYLVKAREMLLNNGPGIRDSLTVFRSQHEMRGWLVSNITGMGYKEAGHFLRNIGLGSELAILDRHILKNMKLLGIIDDLPSNLSAGRYLSMEKMLYDYSVEIGIDMEHLDFVLWYRETGEIFK